MSPVTTTFLTPPSIFSTNVFSGGQLIVGFLISFISGWLAISVFLKVVERVSLLPFAAYLVVMAGVLLYF